MAAEAQPSWKHRTLYEVADYINGRPTKPSEVQADGVPVIKIAELNGGISPSTDRVSPSTVLERHWVHDGDLLFAWSGSIGIYVYRGPKAALNQHIFRVVARSGIDQRFLRYLLEAQLPTFRGFVEDKKTTMGHVTVRDLRATSVLVPEPAEQHAIAQVLGTLDDKIELNGRMAGTLEAVARALFKSWFVDFDPVRAKAEGRDTGLPKPFADLFPDSFEDTELGAIPKGWEVRGLDEIARFLNGLALQKYPPGDGKSLPVIKIAQLRAGHTRGADRASRDLPSDYVVVDGDVLFSWSGSLECVLWAGGRGALNQHLFKVTTVEFPKWFFYLWIGQHLPGFRRIAAAKATTMGHIQRHHLSEAKVVVPPREILTAAGQGLQPLIDAIPRLLVESRSLAALRVELLPKLVSGQVRIENVVSVLEKPT